MRAALRPPAAGDSQELGRAAARRRADLVDAALRDLTGALDGRVALVALGGYGRRLLLPGSDIDLMLLHEEPSTDRLEVLAKAVFYPLWDAGLRVGHAVRTPGECFEVAGERLDAATALLDARPLAGDTGLAERTAHGVLDRLLADPMAFLERVRADARRRREAFGSCAQLLEPDLKESTGGLRDLRSVAWVARVADRGDPGAPALDAAEEFFVRLRTALHREAGRPTDRLHRELHPALAAALRVEPLPGMDEADALLRTMFLHAREVEHLAAAARDGAPTPAPAFETDGLPAAGGRWHPALRASFLETLRRGDQRELEALDRAGILARLLPEWEAVRGRPQRDPYHRYPVDAHLLRTAVEVARLLREGEPEDPGLSAAAGDVVDPDALLLGGFLHDIGKRGEGAHVPLGAGIAASILDRIGVGRETAARARFLVADHLLLSDTATRRDISDAALLHDVAARIGERERLASLYVLTAADARATGPLAWTAWRRSLIRELVGRLDRILRQEPDTAPAQRLEVAKARLRELLGDAAEPFLRRMPRAYLLAVPSDDAARHAALLDPAPSPVEVRTSVASGSGAGTHAVTVVAADRPGLLAMIAGALSLAGLDIAMAQVFTTADGVAVDTFEVTSAADVDEERWRRFRTDLRRALEGRISLEHRIRERRRHYPQVAGEVEVTIDNRASGRETVVDVSAPDRIGLLFDLARALHALALDVRVAKVATYGSRVVDVFYVRDAAGRKIERPPELERLRRAVKEAAEG